MVRRGLIQFMALLLVALPLIGVFAEKSSAASSRVAVIKGMKGTVKVKKSGGSKEFTAFAKMSLNEGDVLKTGAGSSAVLQFANGTSEDDKMTVAANTTLTFSKLSNSKGTSTKVSMFNGSAWVDVKSITSKNDEFSLETPTAIMGVRGTHLLVSVDPATGATHLTVAAGVVSAASTGSGSSKSMEVYPTQNALFTEDEQGGTEITIAPVDLQLLMEQNDASIVQAILENSAAIIAENEQFVARYENEGIPGSLGSSQEDLARFKSNTENLLGAIADQALKSGLLTQERLDQIINEVQSQSGITVDLNKKALQLTEEEQKLKEQQRLKDEEAKKQAAEKKQKEEEERKKNVELLKKLEDERKKQEEANKIAEKAKNQKALEEYQKKLADAEKKRFDDEKNKREQEANKANEAASASPSPSPSPVPVPVPNIPPVLSSNANLSGLSMSNSAISFSPDTLTYSVTVLNSVSSITVTPTTPSGANSAVKINNVSVASGAGRIVTLGSSGSVTPITIVVTAEDGTTTKTYNVSVQRSLVSTVSLPVELTSLGVTFNPSQRSYIVPPVSGTTNNLNMTFGSVEDNVLVQVSVNGASVGTYNTGSSFNVPLATGNNEVVVGIANNSGTMVGIGSSFASTDYRFLAATTTTVNQTYTFQVWRTTSEETTDFLGVDAYNSDLTAKYNLNGVSGIWSGMIPTDVAAVDLKFYPRDPANKIVLNGTTASYRYGEQVSVALGSPGQLTTLQFDIISANATKLNTYSVKLTRAASNVATLSDLKVNGAAVPEFTAGAGTSSYTLDVANNVTSATVTLATTTDPNATVDVTGEGSLAVGNNTLTVKVTAQDGTTTSTYTITVIRATSSIATLSDLKVNGAAVNGFTAGAGTSSYTLDVANNVTSVTVTPTPTDPTATVTVTGGGALVVGDTTITVEVTAQDGTTKSTYTITVKRAASDAATLSDLKVNGAAVPEFTAGAGTSSYTLGVANNVTSATITTTPTDPTATVRIDGNIVASGSESSPISLTAGVTQTITVEVKAQDGTTTQTYTLHVTRADMTNNANVSNILLNDASNNPINGFTFSQDISEPGVITLQENLTQMKLSVSTESNAALVQVIFNHQEITPSGGIYKLPLNQNIEDLVVSVKSGDGTAHRYYHYVFTRGTDTVSDARLFNLNVELGDSEYDQWSPSLIYFDKNVTEYYIYADSGQPEIRLMLDTYNDYANITNVYYGEATLAKGDDGYYSAAVYEGESTIVISVLSQDGNTTQNYYVNIHNEPPLTLPRTVTGWNTTFTGGTIDWQYQGLHRFSAQLLEQITSFDMLLNFDTTKISKIQLTNVYNETSVPIEWEATDVSRTIPDVHEGYNIYNISMYDQNGYNIDNYTLVLYVGSDPQISTEGIHFSDVDYNYVAYSEAGVANGQLSLFVQTDKDMILLSPYFGSEYYYIDNTAVILNGETLSADGSYYLHLNPGMNELLIKMKDFSGLFASTIQGSIFSGTSMPEEFTIGGMSATLSDGTPVDSASITPYVEKFSVASNQNTVKFFPNYSGTNDVFVYQNGVELLPNTDHSYTVSYGEGQLDAHVVVRVENADRQFVSYQAEFEKAGLVYTTEWTSKLTSDSTNLVWYPVLTADDYMNSNNLFTVIPSDQSSIQMTIVLESDATATMYTSDYQDISLSSSAGNTITITNLVEGYNHQSFTIYPGGDQAPQYYSLEILRGEPASYQVSLQEPYGWDKEHSEGLNFLAVDEHSFLKILPETTNINSFDLYFYRGSAIARSEVKFNGISILDQYGSYSINGLNIGWNDIDVTNYDLSGKYPAYYKISIFVGDLPADFAITEWNAIDNLGNPVFPSSLGSDLHYNALVSTSATEVVISPSLVSGSTIEDVYVGNLKIQKVENYYSIPLEPYYMTTYARVMVRAADGHLIPYDLLFNRDTQSDASLNYLNVNGVDLDLTGGTTNFYYDAGSLESVSIYPYASNEYANVQIGESIVDRGYSYTVGVQPGDDNVIVIQVRAADGVTVKEYTIHVNRAFTYDASITNLWAQGLDNMDYYAYVDDYSGDYIVQNVPNSVDEVRLIIYAAPLSTVYVDGVLYDINYPVQVALIKGTENVFHLEVVADDGLTTQFYTLKVQSQPSVTASLEYINLDGLLIDGFSQATHVYEMTLPYNTLTVTLSLQSIDPSTLGEVSLNGIGVTGTNGNYDLDLIAGETNTVSISVVAQSGVIYYYTLYITEYQNTDTTNTDTTNADTTLSSLSLVEPYEYTGNVYFSDGMYHLSLPGEISSIVLNPILGTGQSIANSWRIDEFDVSQPLEWSGSGYYVALNSAETHIFFNVMSADSSTTGTTEVIVTRMSLLTQ
ncbi:cadherin-like beta sandwich domain-containing protein [Cohnella sp.]|uniref:cadherin-like beta sandwich domain-containing protein n=1 Tax=Cohnella sp. TaxID=1883426 RepID=UPI0035681DD0